MNWCAPMWPFLDNWHPATLDSCMHGTEAYSIFLQYFVTTVKKQPLCGVIPRLHIPGLYPEDTRIRTEAIFNRGRDVLNNYCRPKHQRGRGHTHGLRFWLTISAARAARSTDRCWGHAELAPHLVSYGPQQLPAPSQTRRAQRWRGARNVAAQKIPSLDGLPTYSSTIEVSTPQT